MGRKKKGRHGKHQQSSKKGANRPSSSTFPPAGPSEGDSSPAAAAQEDPAAVSLGQQSPTRGPPPPPPPPRPSPSPAGLGGPAAKVSLGQPPLTWASIVRRGPPRPPPPPPRPASSPSPAGPFPAAVAQEDPSPSPAAAVSLGQQSPTRGPPAPASSRGGLLGSSPAAPSQRRPPRGATCISKQQTNPGTKEAPIVPAATATTGLSDDVTKDKAVTEAALVSRQLVVELVEEQMSELSTGAEELKMEGEELHEAEKAIQEMMASTDEDEEDEDEMDGGESSSLISKHHIRKLCGELQATLSFLRIDIEPAAPLSELTEDEAKEGLPPTTAAILEQFKNLRRSMSKLRSQLQPFKERYEEELAKLDSFDGLDKEEKTRKKIEMEEKFFDIYRRSTESSYRRVVFEQQTTLSPMYFTHWTPGQILPYYAETEGVSLQVYSFKITKIKGNLCWPLQVYGVVAARDNADRKRNIIFNRLRHDCQEIFSDDPFLRLTGPSRAIMALSPVNFEVQLKLKGATESEDRALMNLTEHYIRGISNTIMFRNCLCKAELRMEELSNSVQATFLGVRVVDGSCPFEYGGRIACSSPPREVVQMDEKAIAHFVVDSCFQVVLLDSRHCVRGKMPIGKDGCVDLSRRFVSVELQKENYRQFKECLAVVFEAYSESGGIAAQAHVRIKPRTCNISQHTCDLGGSKVDFTIAWSPIVRTDLC